MQHPNVSCFAKLSWPGYRIVDVSFPGKTAEDEFQAAKFEEARSRQGADHVAAATDADN